jgi:transposase
VPTVVSTWAPKGKPPALRHLFRWEHCSIVSAITPAGKLHYRLYLSSIKSQHVVSFLNHLLRRIRGKVLLFLDNGPIHRSKTVKDFLRKNRDRIEERWLPPYAPDINPVEQGYKRLKYVETANRCPMSASGLVQETRLALERIRKRPKLIPSFFEYAGLPLTREED